VQRYAPSRGLSQVANGSHGRGEVKGEVNLVDGEVNARLEWWLPVVDDEHSCWVGEHQDVTVRRRVP